MEQAQPKIMLKRKDELTERQWLLKGYLPKPKAKGKVRYSSIVTKSLAVYFSKSQVRESPEETRQIQNRKNKEIYRQERKKRQRIAKALRETETNCTRYEWLFHKKRIPNNDAVWRTGSELNKTNHIWSYNDSYVYCSFNDTREPRSDRELVCAQYLYYNYDQRNLPPEEVWKIVKAELEEAEEVYEHYLHIPRL